VASNHDSGIRQIEFIAAGSRSHQLHFVFFRNQRSLIFDQTGGSTACGWAEAFSFLTPET
jgi:hypothetical protein